MIPKKLWNSFAIGTKKDILNTLNVSSEWVDKLIPIYNHDFEYDNIGKKLKEVLECIYLQSDGTLKVIKVVTPSYCTAEERKVLTVKKLTKKQERISLLKTQGITSLNNAIKVLPDLLKLIGKSEIKLSSSCHSNYYFEEVYTGRKKDILCVGITWLGDSTDGWYEVKISDILNYMSSYHRDYYVINCKDSYEDRYGYRRYPHDPITIYIKLIYLII